MTGPLDWSVRVIDVPETGLRQSVVATPAEREAVAMALEVLGCERLDVDYVVRPIGGGAYRLAGKAGAVLIQACVVTLDPVRQTAEGEFDVEFRPPAKLPAQAPEDEELEALSAAEVEPLQHGRIDAGRIVFETLSAAVDPYPRAPGAELETGSLEVGGDGRAGPFAALKALKDRT